MARTYRRELPIIDVSTVLIWALEVATVLGAAYYSTTSLRRPETWNHGQLRVHDDQDASDDILEQDARHAVGFMVLVGVFLTVLYYLKIGGVMRVLFAISGTLALTQVV